jgi:RNase P subunit RPR2
MSGIILQKDNGKVVVKCSECGGVIEKATVELSKLMENGKLKKVSTLCEHCESKSKFSVQFLGKEVG